MPQPLTPLLALGSRRCILQLAVGVLAWGALVLHCPAASEGKETFLASLEWLKGPTNAPVGSIGQVTVPPGFIFTGANGTRAILERMGNPTAGRELGFLAPTSLVWFVVYEFDDVGYVKDADKEKLDADALLNSIRRGTEQANERRKQMGASPLNIVGWEVPPRYDPQSNNLEWAIRGESEGRPVVNYNVRVLGRKGVMEVTFVGDPEELKSGMPEFRTLLAGYTFQTGQRYAEYRPGDKVAKYGLAALVVGGAAVGAAKLGLFAGLAVFLKKAWKLIVVAVIAIAGFVRKLILGGQRKTLDG